MPMDALAIFLLAFGVGAAMILRAHWSALGRSPNSARKLLLFGIFASRRDFTTSEWKLRWLGFAIMLGGFIVAVWRMSLN